MNNSPVPDWWPARLLWRHPVDTVFVCGRRLDPPQFSHVVDMPRLELPLRGVYLNHIEVNQAAVNVRLVPGHALFAPPNCWNLPTWRPGLELLSIVFGRTQLGVSVISALGRDFTQFESRKISIPRPTTGPTPAILAALMELHAETGPADVFTNLICALLRCVDELVRQPEPRRTSRARVLLEDIRIFLQSQYRYEITRDVVARQFHVTPNHLSRLFQTHGNMTFTAYLTQVRIDRAKHLLSTYNLKLDDIAARCGYHDTPYFCNVFKRHTQLTPMEYRLKVNAAVLSKPPGAPLAE